MFTDAKRLQQIIKNLLSNAFKFTHHGQVALTVSPVTEGWSYDNDELNRASQVLSFSVSDTGIGIVADKQMIIFEAFQQADGSTSRKYGGTGLGLAISRELSRLLGGEIRLSSVPGKGSVFTLYLPTIYSAPRTRKVSGTQETINANGNILKYQSPQPNKEIIPVEQEVGLLVNELGDDRDFIQSSDVVTLIVENDLGFAKFILDAARSKGHKVLATSLGAVALALTQDYQPDAILLDINLLDMQGWRILERLKNDINTRHIPVCVISTDDSREKALSSGAFAFVAKPIDSGDVINDLLAMLKSLIEREKRHIIAIEPDKQQRESLEKILNDDKFELTFASDVKAAKKLLKKNLADCLIINSLMIEGVKDILKTIQGESITLTLPVIVYGNGTPDKGAWNKLQNMCLAGYALTEDRLLDLVTFYTHQNILGLSEKLKSTLSSLHQSDKQLAGRKVLIVDDDMRNIFALSSVLEEHNMEILSADNGRDAINILKEEPGVEIVLMDIMMPEMDGMETMREIRKIPQLKSLPIVAVTAKAMKGDREKCIEAGAWDYLSKPVDTEQLISTLKAWLNDKSNAQ
jgi:CheY-like chemotaxis protein